VSCFDRWLLWTGSHRGGEIHRIYFARCNTCGEFLAMENAILRREKG